MFWKKKKNKVNLSIKELDSNLDELSTKIANKFLNLINKEIDSKNSERFDEIIMYSFSKTIFALKNKGLMNNVDMEQKEKEVANYFG